MKWIYSTGKKKSAVAKIFLKPNGNKIFINNKEMKKYFPKNYQYNLINQSLEIIKIKFFIKVKVKGGGIISQINAIKLGIAKAIFKYDNNYKKILKSNKLLSSDSRKVERKKIGKKKARKNKQFSKR
ncbi:30S ribosomal protein S9p (S16e) [Candidatus Nasuia deltocephalinicola]|nr:30S ribosomal protein S9p (S16e) [Candidatus Nasuia deltocephalinicola]